MSHRYDHQKGVCLQRQSSAEKSFNNKLPCKFLCFQIESIYYSIYEATEKLLH